MKRIAVPIITSTGTRTFQSVTTAEFQVVVVVPMTIAIPIGKSIASTRRHMAISARYFRFIGFFLFLVKHTLFVTAYKLCFTSPTTVLFDETSAKIMLPAPIFTLSPIKMSPRSKAFAPINTLSPIHGKPSLGFVQVSELGKRIAHPEKPDDPYEAVKDAITSIPLWRALYDKYTNKGVELPDVDFWVDLQQIAELVPDEAKKASKSVRKDYVDDVQYLYSLKGVKSGGQKVSEPNPIDNNQAKPSTLEELKFGDSVRIWLPKENIKDAWTKAKRMIDIYLGVEKKKEES
jgi:hypothetical protein